MPHTDYADPETAFPRLEARVQKTDDDAFSVRIWRWEKPGDGRRGERRQIVKDKRAESYDKATQMIYDCAREEDVIVEPDDIIDE